MDTDYRCSDCGIIVRKNEGQLFVYDYDGEKLCREHYYSRMKNPPDIGILARKINAKYDWDPPV